MQFDALQAFSPVGNECAMRGARNWIFGNPETRREKARDKIAGCSRRRCNDPGRVEASQDRQIRFQVSNCFFGIENCEKISGFCGKSWASAEAFDQIRRGRAGSRWTGWKIELEKVFSPRDSKFARTSLKTN